MLVIITYDVETLEPAGQKRLRKVARICLNHGIRVQNSVFECQVDYSQYIKLKQSLATLIDENKDSIRFYIMGNNWDRNVETLGKDQSINFNGNLIL